MALIDIVKGAATRLGKAAGEVALAGLESFRVAADVRTAAPAPTPAPTPRASPVNVVASDMDELLKAQQGKRRPDDNVQLRGERGHLYDPIEAIGRITPEAVAFSKTHPGTYGLPFAYLDRMARLPVPSTVINLAVHELAEMCHPQVDEHGLGLRVRHKDDEKTLTGGQKKRAKQIEEILFRGGGRFQDGGLDGWCRRVMRNSLVYDAAASEVLFERGGMPYGLFALDARTIRRVPPNADQIARGAWDEAGYCQVVRDTVTHTWPAEDFMYGVRRPRTEMEAFGYGFPELEELITVIHNLTRAENYNAVTFTSGIHSSAVLAFMTDMDPDAFEVMKREIDANLSVSSAKRRMPIVQLSAAERESLQAIQLSMSNREMEFQSWVHYLMKFVWAAFGMDPVIGNFWFGQEGQTSSLATGSPADRYSASRTRGSRPRARALQSWLTKAIVEKIDPDLMAEFGGFQDDNEVERIDNAAKQLSNWMTVDEIRARFDLEPDPDPELGNLILNPIYFQAWSQKQMAQQQPDPSLAPEDENDQSLMDNLFQDPRSGGTAPEIMASLAARSREALRRGLVKPPAGLGRRGRWGLVPGAEGRPPLSISVRA